MTYKENCWISEVSGEVMMAKHFITNHEINHVNEPMPLELLSIVETHFASTIVMLKRFKLIKHDLQAMVISEKWVFSIEGDNVHKARFVKKKSIK